MNDRTFGRSGRGLWCFSSTMKCFSSDDEDVVLVLEYLVTELEKVIKWVSKEGMGWGVEVKRWIVQILLVVDACHRSSVIHRDLKLSNFFVEEDGVLRASTML
nr:cyclin-dependent kinase F-1 [Tanacetum cinerariifolium]